jgi:hypothetical protein
MKYCIALLIVGLSNLTYAIEKIELTQSADHSFQEPMAYVAPFKKETLGYLELGDSLSEAKVIILGEEDESYRIELQLETSISVSAEGPHLDLTNWKHCTTVWHSIKALTYNEFQLPDFTTVSTDCFPNVSHEEIKEEVLKQGGEYWVSVLEKEGLPEDYSPVGVSLSSVRIKVEKLIGTEWEVVTIIDINVPMGC